MVTTRLNSSPKIKNVIALQLMLFFMVHKPGQGPVDPTGKTVSADYVYAMHFEEGLIRHLTKIWNDTISLKQLGWI